MDGDIYFYLMLYTSQLRYSVQYIGSAKIGRMP